MIKSFSGGCACGAIRYEIPSEPVFQNHCQCLDCQKISGTGHGSYLTFSREGVKQSGIPGLRNIIADSGNVKTHAFCAACGSPVFLSFSAIPEIFTVHAASLDDPSRFKPQLVTYTKRGHVWDTLDSELPKFDLMPPM